MLAAVTRFAILGIGRDRPGIVAGVTQRLLEHDANVEDSQMSLLRGHFTMVVVVSLPDDVDEAGLRRDLENAAHELGLAALSLSPVADVDPATQPEPSAVVSVYGADHAGIVHAVAAALAERGIDITDMTTRLVGDDQLYVLLMEVALPEGFALARLEELLEPVARQEGVEVSARPVDRDTL